MKNNKNTIKYTIREKLILFLFENSKNIYRKYFKKDVLAWNITIPKLLNYKENTLGKDLALFLIENNFQVEPKFETHDIYHILSSYPTTVLGEICLSAFNVGSGKKSLYTYAVTLVGSIILIDKLSSILKAYKRGKSAKNYSLWSFEFLLNEKTEDLKALLFNNKNINNNTII